MSWRGITTAVAGLTARMASDVVAHDAIDVVDGTAISWYETSVVPVLSGSRLIDVRPARLVVATGSYDVPALFPGNDKPGVVLADGVAKMLRVERVVPWRRAVVVTDCERGQHLAAQLEEAGVAVVALVDQATDRGPLPAHLPGRIKAARGLKKLRAVDVELSDGVKTFAADLLCVALRERPANDLALQWEYVAAGTPTAVAAGWAGKRRNDPGLTVVGSAAGWLEDDPELAYTEGAAVGTATRGE